MSNEYQANALDMLLFDMRQALRKPIWIFSVIGTASILFGVYVYLYMGHNPFVDHVGEAASRANVWAQMMHPYSGGMLAWLFRVFALLMLASVLGGTWFTYLNRGSYRIGNFWRFATSGMSMVLLCGFAALLSGAVGGLTWVTVLYGLPAIVVMLYAVQGLLFKDAQELAPNHGSDSDREHYSHNDPYGAARSHYAAKQSHKNFATIVGMDELKTKLLQAGKEIKGRKAGARNGILLFGEPGNGKTMFAEALAGELKLPILSISYGDVASKWINQTTEQVVQVFANARRQAPCVLFIDEIDSLIKQRGTSDCNFAQETERTTNAILTEIVALRGTGVVLIGATNFLEQLDSAAIREGRFDYKIEITAPDQPAREAIISSSFAKHAPRGARLENEVLVRAAKRWSGFSASRMAAVGQEAAAKAARGSSVSFELIMAAMRSVQGRAGKIAEDVPMLDSLSLPLSMQAPLKQLAVRMENIVEIEEMGGTVPRGVLFRGPAGTGKTLTAQSLAKTAGWGFLSVAGSDLVRDPAKIDKLFRDAAEIRPCVVFIDESDDLLQSRDFSASSEATNKFLSAMDGAGGKTPDVMIVAATNYPERLDSATLRGGRFTEKIDFAVSDESQAEAMVTNWLQKLKLPAERHLDTLTLVDLLQGQSPANINAVLQLTVDTVAARSLRGGEKLIRVSDVREALRVIV